MLGKLVTRVPHEDADEAVVVDGEDTATQVGHFVEHPDGAVDEPGLDVA